MAFFFFFNINRPPSWDWEPTAVKVCGPHFLNFNQSFAAHPTQSFIRPCLVTAHNISGNDKNIPSQTVKSVCATQAPTRERAGVGTMVDTCLATSYLFKNINTQSSTSYFSSF